MILFCTLECSASQLKSFSIASWQYFSKRNMVTGNRQSFIYTLDTSPPSLLFEPCRGLTNEVAAHFFSSNIVAVRVSLSRGYIIASRLLQLLL